MNNLGEAFTYVFSDRDWPVKFLVGILFLFLSIIVVGIPFVTGYFLEIIRRVARAEPPYLPDWSNLGQLFGRGLVYIVIVFIYALPGFLLTCLLGVILGVFSALLGSVGDGEPVQTGSLVGTALSCLAFPLGLFYTAILPIITIQYAVTGEFGAAFELGEMWNLVRANFGNYIIVILISWATSNLLAPLGLVLCGVGFLATGFYALVVNGYLYGFFHRSAHRPPAPPPMAVPA
jgi:hypothetical protein